MLFSRLSRLIVKTAGFDFIENEIDKQRIKRCSDFCTIGESRFYEEASVINLQHDRGKIRVGNHTHIRGKLQIFKSGGEIRIGDYCYLGENSYVWSAGRIEIGNRVLIAHNVNIHDNISHPINRVERHEDYKRILGLTNKDASQFDLKASEVIIEDDVWIGFNSTILKGVKIGKGSIIGACSLITSDVPPFSLVVGNPQKVIRQL